MLSFVYLNLTIVIISCAFSRSFASFLKLQLSVICFPLNCFHFLHSLSFIHHHYLLCFKLSFTSSFAIKKLTLHLLNINGKCYGNDEYFFNHRKIMILIMKYVIKNIDSSKIKESYKILKLLFYSIFY